MYNEQFIAFGKKANFDADLSSNNINPESIVFIEESGEEGIHTQKKTYQTVPSNGKDGQVLVSSNGRGVWTDIDVLDLLSYGVEWKPNVADPTLTRVGNMQYHKTLPIQSGMKGCILNPLEKRVVYWLDENDWRIKKDSIHLQVNAAPAFIAGSWMEDNPYDDTDYKLVPFNIYGLDIKPLTTGNTIGIKYINFFVKGIVERITSSELVIRLSHQDYNTIISTILSTEPVDIVNPSRLDGYDGEVMVYVPEFYIKSWDEPDRKCVRISPTKIDETWEHQPAVYLAAYRDTLLNTVPVDMGYLSTLQADTAISVANDQPYCRGGINDPASDNYEDIFRRQLGKCRTYQTRDRCRTYIRKAGKELLSYRQYKNIMYWLWVIEYANFNCQAAYTPELTTEGFRQGGMGLGCASMLRWDKYNFYCPIVPNGYTNEFGNRTGVKDLVIPEFTYDKGAVSPAQTLKSVRWRGLEDPFGHIWQTVDGVIIDADADNHPNNMNYVYTTDDPSKYGDTRVDIANMVLSGLEIHTEGYSKEWDLGSTAEIIPRLMGGDSTQYKCDYHWSGSKDAALRVLLLGGSAFRDGYVGLGAFYSSFSLKIRDSNVGFRSVFII